MLNLNMLSTVSITVLNFDFLIRCKFLIQVKFSELTLDNFRMLQCLEWEPSGSFYKLSETAPTGVNCSQEISDPTLPPNPRKAVLHRPSITHFLAVSSQNVVSIYYKLLLF